MREKSCSLEKQLIDILVYVKFILNSIWPGVFNPLFDPRVRDKIGPPPTLFFQITRSV